MEYAYFEGQKDALNGDIRIGMNNVKGWVWTKSPWDDTTPVIFNPAEAGNTEYFYQKILNNTFKYVEFNELEKQ